MLAALSFTVLSPLPLAFGLSSFAFLLAGAVLAAVGCLALFFIQARRRPNAVCLMYHRLVGQEVYARISGTERIFTLSVDRFGEQIEWLEQAGYRFLTADEAHRFVTGQLNLTSPSVLVSFDDGCVSVHRLGLPILRQYGARAILFVTIDPDSYVFKLGDGSDRRMTDDELREADRDVLEIGAHGVTHQPLMGLDADTVRHELAESRRILGEMLGHSVEFLAIPGNWHDRQVVRLAREVGYRAAWCSNPGAMRPGSAAYRLPRINVEGQLTLAQFQSAIAPWGIAQRRLLAGVKRLPGRLLGPRVWLPIRRVLLLCIPGRHLSMRRMILLAGTLLALTVVTVLVWVVLANR